jgi:hypothetical protein
MTEGIGRPAGLLQFSTAHFDFVLYRLRQSLRPRPINLFTAFGYGVSGNIFCADAISAFTLAAQSAGYLLSQTIAAGLALNVGLGAGREFPVVIRASVAAVRANWHLEHSAIVSPGGEL